jgi:Mrp family chromosome partitioning ATPase
LRQVEQQVNDLKRNIGEEIDRFAQSAKNDLTRAREYEASLNKALETQKRQSVLMSQASVRLRELEREVEASRDVYQSFLKRSRETEEQETLNTSSARITGEATVPQRRTFPPAMSLLAMVGFMLGGLAAAGWTVAADRLTPRTPEAQPRTPGPSPKRTTASVPVTSSTQPPRPRPASAAVTAEKPLIAQLQESDVVRTLGGILRQGGVPDATRIGWPTLRAGSATTFFNAMRDISASLAKRSAENAVPVMAVIGAGSTIDRSIAALNIALAAARDGASVLMIDADHAAHALSDRLNGFGKAEPSRLGWLSIGSKASRAIKTANGISILPVIKGTDAKASEAIRKAIAQARSAGGYDLVILDGPAMPCSGADRKLTEIADGLVAILPVRLDINECMEEIIEALGGAERKLIGVVLYELTPIVATRQRERQYA